MKLKIIVKEKDFILFIIICLFLFIGCTILAANFISFSGQNEFVGMNIFENYSMKTFGVSIFLFISSLVAIFANVSSTIFDFDSGFGIKFGEKEEKGYNKFMSVEEMKKAPKVKKVKTNALEADAAGIPFINDGKNMWVDNGENHTLIIGQSGSGKTTALVDPQVRSLMKHNESMVITDLKGEIYRDHGAELKERGYKIIIINLRDPQEGNAWNPLTVPYRWYKQGKKDKAIELLEDISNNIIISKNNNNDPFWETSASQYFCGLALGLFKDANENEINISSISNMISAGETKNGLKTFAQDYFLLKGEESPEYGYAKSTINAPNETRNSVLSVLESKIRQFTSRQNLSEMLSYSDFNMEDIGREKTAVFLIVHDEKTTYHALATIFVKQLYEVLIDVAHKNLDGKLKYRTNFILDEFANMPELKDVDAMVTAARSRQVRFTFIIQNFAQLDDVYGEKKAETIRSNCGNMIYLLTTELHALEQISKLLGEKKSKDKDKTVSTPLVTVSDLQKMKMNEIIVLRARQKPFRTKLKAGYQTNWGKEYEEVVPPDRDEKPVKLFNLKEFVKEEKRKKNAELANDDNGFRPSSLFDNKMPNPNKNPEPRNPFGMNPGMNIDEIVKNIDAQIAKLEAEEAANKKKEEEAKKSAIKSPLDEILNANPFEEEKPKPSAFDINTPKVLDSKIDETQSKEKAPFDFEALNNNQNMFDNLKINQKEIEKPKVIDSNITNQKEDDVLYKQIEERKHNIPHFGKTSSDDDITDDQFFDDFFGDE